MQIATEGSTLATRMHACQQHCRLHWKEIHLLLVYSHQRIYPGPLQDPRVGRTQRGFKTG